ncbi:MAG: CehA/McbA family metallohydrolase [Pirellulaceae bacterium]
MRHSICILLLTLSVLLATTASHAREPSMWRTLHRLALQQRESNDAPLADGHTRLRFRIALAPEKSIGAGTIKISQITADGGRKPLELSGVIERDHFWYTIDESSFIDIPSQKISIDIVKGIESEMVTLDLDLTSSQNRELVIPVNLERFSHLAKEKMISGNTHVHIMRRTYRQATDYLQLVPESDDLRLVWVSHLRRIPDEREYITNQFTPSSLHAISTDKVTLGFGEEHRHNFGIGGEGWGHVMLLDIPELIRPVSIGPGIMRSGSDGLPVQKGILKARNDGGTVIWCHNDFGLEDIANWTLGFIHAQNIFDGGSVGSYDATFYRYLNVGMQVPFSTGTDWFIYDYSRAYVPVRGRVTSNKWLTALRKGESFITNGPLLTFTANQKDIGSTIQLDPGSNTVQVKATGKGRTDFKGLELVHNGHVIAAVETQSADSTFVAEMNTQVDISEPGWLAVRVPIENNKNIYNRLIFGHTSPIYFEQNGQSIFDPDVALDLMVEMQQARDKAASTGQFDDEAARNSVIGVYDRAIKRMEELIESGGK